MLKWKKCGHVHVCVLRNSVYMYVYNKRTTTPWLQTAMYHMGVDFKNESCVHVDMNAPCSRLKGCICSVQILQ